MADTLDKYKGVQAQVLLILGGKTHQEYLKAPIPALEKTLPHARQVELPGLDHGK
jgi:hypothetical protein